MLKDKPEHPGKPPGKPETGEPPMSTAERSVPMEITIKVGKDSISERKFLLYPGTEMVYGQGVDLAVTQALGTISKVAYELISGAEGVPESVAIEAMFGKAMQA